jgi:hypothetical protein
MASEAASTNATAARYYRALFVAAAVWNLLALFGVLFVLENSKVRTALGFPGAPDNIALQLLASCLLLFGLGYYWVSRDLSRNHDLVWLGVIGKPLVFIVFFWQAVAGHIPARLAAPSMLDLLFGVLFAEFLLRYGKRGQ